MKYNVLLLINLFYYIKFTETGFVFSMTGKTIR